MAEKRKDSRRGRGTAVAVVNTSVASGALIQTVQRSSALAAPIIQLAGHKGEVYACRFDGSGQVVASGSQDRTIQLWNVYGGNENFGQIRGHKGAVLDLAFARDSRSLFSASADATLGVWDVDSGVRVRRHEGHGDMVNSVAAARRGAEVLVSGSDDGAVGLWDPRTKHAAAYLETDFPVLAVAFGAAGTTVFSAGIDHAIKAWDLRQRAVVYTLDGHTEAVTGLDVSADDQFLVSNGMDSTVRVWDARPFAPANRQMRVLDGAPASDIEKNLLRASWSPDGTRVVAGSADRTVVVWDVANGRMLHKLPGHTGAVNDARFSPAEPSVVVTASTDTTLVLGELNA
ncbi:WD40-repeat-containing domain protein [Dipodascopsis tothii]|uniref:WD40-repeat-containing domain protein n=1 Tax=Dipodascopsis tothii TaxID=44089 RepID=UPI0034CEC3A5